MKDKIIPKICDSFKQHAVRGDTILCNVRLNEMALELYGSRSSDCTGHSFELIHPTVEACEKLRNERATLDLLDVQQCSAVLFGSDILKEDEIESLVTLVKEEEVERIDENYHDEI
jgi:hypothetical protein